MHWLASKQNIVLKTKWDSCDQCLPDGDIVFYTIAAHCTVINYHTLHWGQVTKIIWVGRAEKEGTIALKPQLYSSPHMEHWTERLQPEQNQSFIVKPSPSQVKS